MTDKPENKKPAEASTADTCAAALSLMRKHSRENTEGYFHVPDAQVAEFFAMSSDDQIEYLLRTTLATHVNANYILGVLSQILAPLNIGQPEPGTKH